MFERATRWVAIFFAVAALAACRGERNTSATAAEGAPFSSIRPAPEFRLETLDGDTLSLAQLGDRKAILMNFWASWCFPCKDEMPGLIALDREYRDRGLAVLGVTVEDLPRDSRAFVRELEVPYPSIIGTPAMLEAYGVAPWLPTTLLVKDGQIVREWVGPRTRRDLEYPIRVALGLTPPLEDVTRQKGNDGGR